MIDPVIIGTVALDSLETPLLAMRPLQPVFSQNRGYYQLLEKIFQNII